MHNRKQRAEIAQQTLQILDSGSYSINGRTVGIRDELELAIRNTRYYQPNDYSRLSFEANQSKDTIIEVTNETTFGAASRLVNDENETNVICLNFASAKNPGGGFLGGSQAQEESLARSSGLYPCIEQIHDYYDYHRARKSCLYSDRMIYSPNVPVFRDDNNELLNRIYTVSIMTAPAVNCTRVKQSDAVEAMRIRIEKLLTACAANGHDTLILGAWGCGVFRNDPNDIAELFREQLENMKFYRVFKRVVFAVLDRSGAQTTLKAFENALIK